MKKIYLLAVCLFLILSMASAASPAHPQAVKWLKLALQEKNLKKRLEALTKAVSYDSLFVEALYQLGQAYLEQQNEARAEFYFDKANAHLFSSAEASFKTKILYELAVTKLKLGKPGEAEAALREARTLATERPMQAALAHELAALLYQQRRYAEAFETFVENAQTTNPPGSFMPEPDGELQALYIRAQGYGGAGAVEQAVAAYDSLWLRAGVLHIVGRLARTGAEANMKWPLSTALVPSPPSNKNFVYWGGAVAALIFLPLFGFMFFSPFTRANFHLWQKNYLAATQTFEKLLKRNPQKTNVYAPLAELYLRLGRNDERALKVYKTVLHLNLRTRKRDEMNTVLAQKYLAEGRTDSDVIEVLENALKSESRKQSLSLAAAN